MSKLAARAKASKPRLVANVRLHHKARSEERGARSEKAAARGAFLSSLVAGSLLLAIT
jgi:hypothetical protein